jgi:hypothetical protein
MKRLQLENVKKIDNYKVSGLKRKIKGTLDIFPIKKKV